MNFQEAESGMFEEQESQDGELLHMGDGHARAPSIATSRIDNVQFWTTE
jgi:hypothetical protein